MGMERGHARFACCRPGRQGGMAWN
jgi:hypothetical protein